jgi:hypothetical protein
MAVAAGTILLAVVTRRLADESREQRLELRAQHLRSLDAQRQADQRRDTLRLRKVVQELESATLDLRMGLPGGD